MIAHVFPKSQFTEGYIKFINNNFDSAEHVFVLYTNKKFELPQELYSLHNVIDYDTKNMIWLVTLLSRAEKIFLHNLSVNIYELLMLYTLRWLTHKVIWVVWGGDLYCYRDPKTSMMDKFVEWVRKGVIRQIPMIATLTDGDYELAKRWYGVRAKHVRVNYCDEKEIRIFQELSHKSKGHSGETYILVGNSATKTNRHLEAFERIAKYKHESIRVYVPLSYGDMEYAVEVAKKGKEIFGDKFYPIMDFMTQEDYFGLLNEMDVGIFNNDRQQAIGNIIALLFLGKKLYLRDDTSMWDEWVNKEKYLIHCIGDIDKESYSEFILMNQNEINMNYELTKEHYDVASRVKEWQYAFDMSGWKDGHQ